MSYTYVREIRRYRDNESGQFVSRQTVLNFVDEISFAADDRISALVSQFNEGVLSAQDFGTLFKTEVKDAHITQAILGRGGRDEMQAADWGQVGRTLRDQYAYMDGFISDLDSGRYAVGSGAIEVRAQMYMRASRQSYEKANASAWGVRGVLPANPGDGQSECVTSCRCNWVFQEMNGDVLASWITVSDDNTCPTCSSRGTYWSPLIIRDGKIVNADALSAPGVMP